MTESLYCPPEIQNIVNWLYSKTKLEALKKKKGCADAGEKQVFSAAKQGAGVRGKKQIVRRTMGHSSFLKKCIEVRLIFSVALSSVAQQNDSVTHIQKYIFFFLFFSLQFISEY